MRVLLIEDDPLVGEGIQVGLRLQGMAVDWIANGRLGQAALRHEDHDAVILDLALPERGGLELLRDFRDSGGSLPVLILTAFDAVPDRVAGLDAGADDYLSKPFDLQELGARLRALHRRHINRAHSVLRHGKLVFDPGALTIHWDGRSVDLPRREAELLQLLLEQAGRVVTTEQIHNRLYGWSEPIGSNAPAVHIHNLRRKLGRGLIETVRGIGYRIPKEAS